jgi:hypothetical protein
VVSCLCSRKVVTLAHPLVKDETWYVQEVEFLYRWVDKETGIVTEHS